MQITFNLLDATERDVIREMIDGMERPISREPEGTTAEKVKAPVEKTKKAAPKPKPKPEPEPEETKPQHTREEVRAKLKEYAALEGKDAAIQILKDHGASSITELSEDKFDAVFAACDTD